MSIPFVTDDPVTHGTAVHIEPGLQRIVAANPSPFTFTGSSTYLLGTQRLTVVDPGPDLPGHLDALLAAIEGRPIERILITHRHRDHAGLAHQLKAETGAPIAAHTLQPSSSNFAAFKTGLMDESMVQDLAVDHALNDGDEIDCNGEPLTVVHTPGHTSDHCCFYLRSRSSVFTGDHVMGWSTTVIAPPEGNMSTYMRGLRRIKDLQPNRLIPTHGVPIAPAVPFLEALIQHREMREAQAVRELSKGPQKVADMVVRLYPDLPPALIPAAELSLLGHLDALISAGRVELDGSQPLDHPFKLT